MRVVCGLILGCFAKSDLDDLVLSEEESAVFTPLTGNDLEGARADVLERDNESVAVLIDCLANLVHEIFLSSATASLNFGQGHDLIPS